MDICNDIVPELKERGLPKEVVLYSHNNIILDSWNYWSVLVRAYMYVNTAAKHSIAGEHRHGQVTTTAGEAASKDPTHLSISQETFQSMWRK